MAERGLTRRTNVRGDIVLPRTSTAAISMSMTTYLSSSFIGEYRRCSVGRWEVKVPVVSAILKACDEEYPLFEVLTSQGTRPNCCTISRWLRPCNTPVFHRLAEV